MKALKKLLLAVLAFCVTVCVGIFALACNTDKGDKGEEGNKPPVTQPGDNEGGDNEGGDNEGGDNEGGDNEGGDNEGGDNEGGDNEGNEYTVTLNVGEGALGAGESTSLKTVNGKLSTLPEPTISKAHWRFDNWYDAEGKAIDEKTFVFEEDTTLYAKYIRDNGVWDSEGETYIAGLTRNTGETTGVQWWLGGSSVAIDADAEISLYINGEAVSFYIMSSSTCVDKSVTDEMVEKVTVTADAYFKIYLWDHTDEENPNWSCEFSGRSSVVNEVSSIPVNCGTIQIEADNGIVTFYIVDALGRAVSSEEFNDFRLYTFEPELFGNWTGSETNGALALNMTGEGDITVDTGFILRWGNNFGTQSANMFNIQVGNTYFIDLSADTQEAKLYTGDPIAPRPGVSEAEELFVANGAYLVGSGFDHASYNELYAGYYIDPVDGLTVTLNKNADVQFVKCTNGKTGAFDWVYQGNSTFIVEGGAAYIDFNGGHAGSVVTAGEYTITVEFDDEGNGTFTITPAEGLQPDTEVVYYDSYIVGANFSYETADGKVTVDANGAWNLTTGLKIDLEEGVTVTFTANSAFQIIPDLDGEAGWGKYKQSNFAMKEGTEATLTIPSSGNWSITPGTYKVTQVNEDEGTVIYFEKLDVEGGDTAPDDGEEEEVAKAYYLIGGMNGWALADTAESAGDYAFTDNGEGTYSLTVSLVAGNEFKIAVCGNGWVGAFGESALIRGTIGDNGTATADGDYQLEWTNSDNINVGVSGTYTFTFTPDAESNQQLTYTFTAESAD